jgi:hypothetical protein
MVDETKEAHALQSGTLRKSVTLDLYYLYASFLRKRPKRGCLVLPSVAPVVSVEPNRYVEDVLEEVSTLEQSIDKLSFTCIQGLTIAVMDLVALAIQLQDSYIFLLLLIHRMGALGAQVRSQ